MRSFYACEGVSAAELCIKRKSLNVQCIGGNKPKNQEYSHSIPHVCSLVHYAFATIPYLADFMLIPNLCDPHNLSLVGKCYYAADYCQPAT